MNDRNRLTNLRLMLAACALFAGTLCGRADAVDARFANPPASARPWVYWFPLDGNITSNGITADLEAMARVGIGGVLYMETAQGTPKGPAPFASDAWFALLRHACNEAARLGLEINMNNDAGWCGSGGPWITPEQSMQKVVWSEKPLDGPARFDAKLPQPETRQDYYRDIAVFAFPTPAKRFRIPQLNGKTCETRAEIPLRAAFPGVPPDAVIPRGKLIELTDKMSADGRLAWDVPEGRWTVLRMGHTSTGKDNHPAPEGGRGLECDKLSPTALDTHFDHLMAVLAKENRRVTGSGKTLIRTHIDSWETHSQNWTPRFREEFRRLRGYDPLPLLPAMAGRVIDGAEISERFLWDVRQTVNDLLLANYVDHMRERAHGVGLDVSIEAYGDGPFDNLAYAGRCDEPMSEFWSWPRYGSADSCIEMSSAAHIYGKTVHGAEAFTAIDAEKWQGHPGNIKDIGDWAFCAGVNRFVFHRYALQPWADVKPGVSMGPWGLHYERTQTWWEQSRAWHTYLARCQVLLRQGLTVADLCFLTPENAPQSFHSPVKGGCERPDYSFDGCPPDAALTRLSVKDGRVTLPDGMSYRLLVLPKTPAMTPKLLRKIRDLIAAGATVLGNPPLRAPGLAGYPQCDDEVRGLAREIWGGDAPPAEWAERPFGKGRVIWGRELQPPPDSEYAPDLTFGQAKWIWFNEGHPAQSAPPEARYFRRTVVLEAGAKVASANLVLTADNEFECWLNGLNVGSGNKFDHASVVSVGHLLRPGANVIAVKAVNTTDAPNPAGLIAALTVKLADGHRLDVVSDGAWEASKTAFGDWRTATAVSGWSAALELGPLGMRPWGEPEVSGGGNTDTTPSIAVAARVLERLGVAPDFTGTCAGQPVGLRYIHKWTGKDDVYFVANKDGVCRSAACAFRVTGKRPELWWPDTGRTEAVAAFEEKDGRTRLTLRLDPFASVFVVFRQPVGAFDPVVALIRDGEALLPEPKTAANLTVQKALYGLLDDPSAMRDVTANVQALFTQGVFSFPVTDMAKGDDPAFGRVKTLKIDCTGNSQPLTVSNTDGQTVIICPPSPPLSAALHSGAGGAVTLEAFEPGRYLLRTAAGKTLKADVADVSKPFGIDGPWQVTFDPRWGGPEKPVTFKGLSDWADQSDLGIKYYSGAAVYRTTFNRPETRTPNPEPSLLLDLGRVEVMAQVTLNGHAFETLWKKPYELDVTDAVKAGANTLEVKVVNLWINRLIGDEQLPDDSPRKKDGRTLDQWPDWLLAGQPSPTGRFTFTSHRLWKKDDPLVPSGLLGPVSLRTSIFVKPVE